MLKYTNLYDATKCSACRGCMVACKQWNQLPGLETEFKGNYQVKEGMDAHSFTYIKFNEEEGTFQPQWYFSKHQCMHCHEPACVDACPRHALSQTEWGAVVKDFDKCIGCQYCVAACPFDVPKYDKAIDKVTKCTLCANRVQVNLEGGDPKTFQPACAKTCPTGALVFGERESLLAKARERVSWLRANGHPEAIIYGEHELGGLNKLYIFDGLPEKYGFPNEPKRSSVVNGWQNIVQPWFGLVIPLALAGSTASFFTSRWLKNKREQMEGGAGHGNDN